MLNKLSIITKYHDRSETAVQINIDPPHSLFVLTDPTGCFGFFQNFEIVYFFHNLRQGGTLYKNVRMTTIEGYVEIILIKFVLTQ